MKPLPWRIVAVTDLGIDPGRTAPVARETLGRDLAAVSGAVEIPGAVNAPGPGGPVKLAFGSTADFAPSAVAARLAEASGGSDPDAAGNDDLDAVLHHPLFQRRESAWRGLELLLAETGDTVAVEVLSTPREKLLERIRELVVDPGIRTDEPPTLVLLDFDFTHRPGDLALLKSLSDLAMEVQAPVVAAGTPAFFDFRHMAHVLALSDFKEKLTDPAHAGFRDFQAGEGARWVCLTLNRYLQRSPYAEEGGYRESVSESRPESFLWGRGVWLVGAAVARSARLHGHGFDLAGPQGGRFAGLGTRAYPVAANQTAPLSTEVPLPDMKAQELSRAAFTPLVGQLRSDVAVLPMVVTVSRLAPGRLTVEGTLAYQITASRLAQFCSNLLGAVPAGGDSETRTFITEALTGFLGSLAGDDAASAVQVTVAGGGPRTAEVHIRPAVPLEGKDIEFAFVLPLRNA